MTEAIRLVIIAGIRPQFIKMTALLDSIRKHNQASPVQIYAKCVNTGQHYCASLSTQLFHELRLSFDFEIDHANRNPDAILANSFIELSQYFRGLDPCPDWIVVFGDGNPAVAGALAAARQGCKLVHIEAGEKRERYEHEEINRRVVDSLADVHFCVSQRAVSCLAEDGILNNVYWTGDLAYDFTMESAHTLSPGVSGIAQEGYVLVTIHRPENLEREVLQDIVTALSEMSREVVFLCHPRTKRRLQELDLYASQAVQYLDPLSYLSTLAAIKGCAFLLTDAGGIVREASHLGKRCVVRRNGGAWPELMERGFNVRVGTSLAELREGLARMDALSKQHVRPPQLLYRPNGIEEALDVLCTLAKAGAY